MFGLFRKESVLFPELKTGDYVYFKEEDHWEEKGDNIGVTYWIFGHASVLLNPKKAYKIQYINKNGDGYVVEVGDLFLRVYDKNRKAIKSIAQREK